MLVENQFLPETERNIYEFQSFMSKYSW